MAVQTEAQFDTRIANALADNTTGAISEGVLRAFITDLTDSLAFRTAIADFLNEAGIRALTASVTEAGTSERATLQEGRDGTDGERYMTPHAVVESIAAHLQTVTQSEAEAGTSTQRRAWTAQRVAQAVAALGTGGGLTQAQVDARITERKLIAPKDTYLEADVGDFVFEDGVLKRVERDPHGPNTVTWAVLGSADEGGGTGQHFRGFHRRPGAVSSPVSGDFFASTEYGDFEVRRVAGEDGHTTTGWFSYNPFEAGEYWESSGGQDIEDNYRVVEDRAEALAAVTAIGQAFVVLDTREVIFDSAFAAGTGVEFVANLYDPPSHDTLVDLDDVPDTIGTAGQVLKVNADRSGFEFGDDDTGSGGGGLTNAQVRALIADPAEEGNTDTWHPNKLPAATAGAQGAVQLATNAEAGAGTNTERAVTPTGLASRTPNSSAGARGLVELATVAEATAGTDTERAVTPAGLAAAIAAIGGTAHDLIVGWSADAAISDAEIAAGATSDTDTATIPISAGNLYLFVWRADPDGGDPSEVHIAGGGNQRNIFGAAVARTVGTTAGQLIVSVTTQNAGLLGGEELRVV